MPFETFPRLNSWFGENYFIISMISSEIPVNE